MNLFVLDWKEVDENQRFVAWVISFICLVRKWWHFHFSSKLTFLSDRNVIIKLKGREAKKEKKSALNINEAHQLDSLPSSRLSFWFKNDFSACVEKKYYGNEFSPTFLCFIFKYILIFWVMIWDINFKWHHIRFGLKNS